MSTLTLSIIRHAERPNDSKAPWPGGGFTEEGAVDEKSLVIRGWQRAGSWAALFGAGLGGDDFPQPTAIYAADPKSMSGGAPSQRPFETISPLALRLRLKPITRYALGDEAKLVKEIVGLTGVVLVCWEHKAICGKMLPAVANGQTLHGMPTDWKGSRFDVVLRFDRSVPGAPWSFRQLFPRLLSDDTDTPLQSAESHLMPVC
jgi:hypothetical protein